VLERLEFSLVRQFRVDLSTQQTARFDSTEPWPGWDLEYALEANRFAAPCPPR